MCCFRYDVSNVDDAYIDSRIEEMDNIFSLVLITDYFDESLIMMKNRLCWDWEDIVYIKFKMRIEEAKTEVDNFLTFFEFTFSTLSLSG